MKILTVLGTRPELIRLSRVMPLLDSLCDHKVVHTGQNYDVNLKDVFYSELEIRPPDYALGVEFSSTFEQIGKTMMACEKVFQAEKPDKFLTLGDTNSALSAIVAKKFGVPVFHMEAGNRCFNDKSPEEVNRRLVDHSSDLLMPYTERSRANLLAEGIESRRIFVTGNPIFEVLEHYKEGIENSGALEALSLEPGKYFLVTLHRAENVDKQARLEGYVRAFEQLHRDYGYPVICSVHPRTRSRLEKAGILLQGGGVIGMDPFGFFDFVKLEKNAFCVLTDSGTVQEECAIFNVPSVILRDFQERSETVEVGSAVISGARPEAISLAVKAATKLAPTWKSPPEYMSSNVSNTVAKIMCSHFDLNR
ncbi:MAG: UDP-N-acetylglucosamine 2-epimerase (non-hydrolyzing) [Nitrospinota bacterium]|nr:UDP-N-acetylglucosamine 2-epimerase (non-hydrolyzing) [Nitrospinota bacterium]